MSLPSLDALDVDGERVLVRADLNVPLVEGTVGDDFRIESSLPTIQELRKRGASVIVATHLGRPDGFDAALSTKPIAERLGELGGFPVAHAPGVIGEPVEATIDAAGPDTVVVLENTRFEAGESTNDPLVADGLAALATYFVNDAFGTAHRTQASTVGVALRLRSAAGLLLAAELTAFDRLLSDPSRPYVVVLGGAKISDKLGVMQALLPEVDLMLIGGGMCFTLLAAGGYEVGDSLVDRTMIPEARTILDGIHGSKVVLPEDVVVADSFAADAPHRVVSATAIPDGTVGLDIGPAAIKAFAPVIEEAERVFWNGPMGVFEWDSFRNGTRGVAAAAAASDGYTVVGGGESVAALRLIDRAQDVDHLSTGGGAGLAMLEGTALPGIVALERWS
ncbi:MAG: phosphoglycerate kinase [Acidimicrobiia bacterium]|nr:MAG: phosphoglycerate kinase [Acidimicrobiia bacterium]